MTGIRIYVEGGGDTRHGKRVLGEGFRTFFEPLRERARTHRIGWDVILCGSRNGAFDDFRTALAMHPESLNLLLVDAEGPVTGLPWDHLKHRDGWDIPKDIDDNRCHLMVQFVESWLVCDPEALAAYYGQDFNENALPRQSDIEGVPKSSVEEGLERATGRTQKGRYRKIRHCAELLKRISQEKVRARAKYCDRLFKMVEVLIETGQG